MIYANNENQINSALSRNWYYYLQNVENENLLVEIIKFVYGEDILEYGISNLFDTIVPGAGMTIDMFYEWYSENKPDMIDVARNICKKVSNNYTKPFILKRYHDVADRAYIFDAEEWKEKDCVKGPKGMVGSFNNY